MSFEFHKTSLKSLSCKLQSWTKILDKFVVGVFAKGGKTVSIFYIFTKPLHFFVVDVMSLRLILGNYMTSRMTLLQP